MSTSTKKFKTKLTGGIRAQVVAQGRAAAKDGWERKSPYKGRAIEAWLEGYDEPPSMLVHCTICGCMHTKTQCPDCGDETSQRKLNTGDIIYMTKKL